MADKTMNAKQPEKPKVAAPKAAAPKAAVTKAAAPKAKAPERKDDKPKQPNRVQRWWHETVGELRKVSWPTYAEARRLTIIVLAVMGGMAVLLGSLDYAFSRLISLMVK